MTQNRSILTSAESNVRFSLQVLTGQAAVRETKEEMWEVVSPSITALLQEDSPDLPRVTPFDASLEVRGLSVKAQKDNVFFYLQVEVEDQKVMSLYRIQDCVKRGKVRMALSLLRASREVSNVTA